MTVVKTESPLKSPSQDGINLQHDALKGILSCGLIPIIRGDFSESQVCGIAACLAENGITVVEMTLNSPGALTCIEVLRKKFAGRMLVGAGTVRTKTQLLRAVDAGAQFSISPNLDPDTVAAALQSHFLHLPGVLTPTEVQQAVNLGCPAVKLFPVDSLGAKYLKAVRAPLEDVMFIPTGGVTSDNAAEFAAAGAAAVGVGSALVTGPTQSLEDLATRAKKFRQAWDAKGAR